MAVVSRMSIQVLQGTRVRAALKKPGHPKARSQSDLVPAVPPGQRGELQGQIQQTGPQGEIDLPCTSGLMKENRTHKDSDGTPHLAWGTSMYGSFHLRRKMVSGPPIQQVQIMNKTYAGA